ncbi:MAG: ABC transporter ATP-binding protein [Mycoplasma sp.]
MATSKVKTKPTLTYHEKLAIWRKFATFNIKPTKCSACTRKNAHKTVLLENGKHICWYSWIKKNSHFKSNVTPKKASMVDIDRENKEILSNNKFEQLLSTEEKIKLKEAEKKLSEKIRNNGKLEDLKQLESGVLIEDDMAQGKSKSIDTSISDVTKIFVVRSNKERQQFYNDLIGKNAIQHKVKNICRVSDSHNLKYGNIIDEIIDNEMLETKNPIVKNYIRLANQPQKEKFTMTDKTNSVIKGQCSFDKKTKYAVEMINITKSFLNGKIVANDDVTIRVKKNEIHAIIGENGAGKSTLMSVLFGMYTPDSGTIKINGQNCYFNTAMDASKAGLGMVHQHFQLVPTNTIFENIILGREDVAKHIPIIKEKEAREKIQALIEKYDLNLDINRKVSSLTVGQQQKTEILKLLYNDAEILIFDEPTAVLSPNEITHFLKMLKDLQAVGKTIILITHKFTEIKEVADRASIIRLGRFVSDFNVKDKSIQEMAEEMVGKAINLSKNEHIGYNKTKRVLEVRDVKVKLSRNKLKEVEPVNFDVHAGEVFAIAGVEGNGQSELALIISGLNLKSDGHIYFHGKDVIDKPIKKRFKQGLSFIPESRHEHGLILDESIAMNTVSNDLSNDKFSWYGFLKDKFIKENARVLIRNFDVRGTTRGSTPARGLSGGNQQKLIIGRELSKEHSIVLMVQPTRGLDLGAVKYVHEKILEEKRKGNAVVLISYELDEILSLADTVAVMSEGSFAVVDSIKNMSRQRIGEIMAGKE